MRRLLPAAQIFLVFLLFLLANLPGSGAEEHGHVSSTSNRRPRRKAQSNRPYIMFNTKSLVCLPLQRSKMFRIKTRIFSTSRVTFRWMRTSAEGLSLGDRLKTADKGRQFLLQPPFTEDDSGTYNVLACNRAGCTARGVQIIFYEDELFENESKTKSGRGAKTMAWIGGTLTLLIVSLVVTAVILRRHWSRWIFMKKVKAEYRSQTTSLHGGNDPCSWLWTWRTASQAGFHTSDEEEGNEYDDPLRLNTKKAKRKRVKWRKQAEKTKKSGTPDQPSVFKQMHERNRPKFSLPSTGSDQQNEGNLADSSEGQSLATDSSSKDGHTSNAQGKHVSLLSQSNE